MNPWLTVFLGAGLGGALRHGVNVAAARMLGTGFPFGTLIVNVAGCFVMGVLVGVFARFHNPSQTTRLFLTTGVLGGFTTFSTYAVDTRRLLAGGHPGTAFAYLLATLLAALTAVWLGATTTRRLVRGGQP